MSLQVTLTSLDDTNALAREWQTLEREADGSFFISWAWISAWLQHVPGELTPHVLRIHQQGALIALGLLVRRNIRRYRVLSLRAYYLHETGDRRLDEVTMEYNGLLVRKGLEATAWQAFVAHFNDRDDWDELYLSGLAPPSPPASALQMLETPRKAHRVELTPLRANDGDYLASLSANTKYQMRAALKAYEKTGALQVDVASTTEQALAYLDALIVLHQKYWQGKGQSGAFADADFDRFHRRLIAAQHPQGAVQLLRIRAGASDIGYLYNFVWRGRIYNYQTGFDYDLTNKKKKPGFVCHYLAIAHALKGDASIYDFMAGDTQYKRSLSTHEHELKWLILQKDRFAFRLERRLKDLKRWLRTRGAPR